MRKEYVHLDIETLCLLLAVYSIYFKFMLFLQMFIPTKMRHTTGTGNIMIVAAAAFPSIGYTKLQKLSSLLNLKIPQETSVYEHHRQFVFPEMDAAWRKNQLEQKEEIKSSGRMLEFALDGQCDSPGHNAMYNIVSAKGTATNKLINFRVVHAKVCIYLNEPTHYISCCDFCILRAQS